MYCQVYTWTFPAKPGPFLEKRFQIVEEHENSKGLTGTRKLAEKFGCGKTQESNILKQKTLVREEYERGFSSAKKPNRTSLYSDVNDAVLEWFNKKTEQRIPVDGPLIQEFATKVAEKLGYPEFKASSGWLTRFKERNNLSQHKLCGEVQSTVVQCTLGKSVLGQNFLAPRYYGLSLLRTPKRGPEGVRYSGS